MFSEDLPSKLQAKDNTIKDLEHKVNALIHEHAHERERLLNEVQSLQRQLSEKNSCVGEFEAQLGQAHEAMTSVEERMKSLEQERTELTRNVESLQRELTDKTARIQALNNVEARQCDMIDELQQQLQELRGESEQREEDIVKLNKSMEALKHDKQLLQETINTLQLAATAVSTHNQSSTRDQSSTHNQSSIRDQSSTHDQSSIRDQSSTRDQHTVIGSLELNGAPITSPKHSNLHVSDTVASGPVVCFSGFKEKDTLYNDTLKKNLTQFVVHVMKGQVHDTAEFSHNITHVVTPPHARTLKTLAAVLTCKWLVTPEWLIDAKRAHDADPAAALLGPEKYGIRLQEPPFKAKTFAFHSSFSAGAEGVSNLKNAEILLKVGKGKRVKESEATVVLVSDEFEGQKSSYYSWKQFMDIILEHVPPLLKERPKRKVDKLTNPEEPKQKKTKL